MSIYPFASFQRVSLNTQQLGGPGLSTTQPYTELSRGSVAFTLSLTHHFSGVNFSPASRRCNRFNGLPHAVSVSSRQVLSRSHLFHPWLPVFGRRSRLRRPGTLRIDPRCESKTVWA